MRVALYFKAIPDSIDVYKGIFLQIIPVRIVVLWSESLWKVMFSLHLSKWLEWKCRGAAQLVGFLYSVVESLRSTLMWMFMSSQNICWVECWKVNLIVRWEWFMKSCSDGSWFVVPRKIMKMSSMNVFQKRNAQIKTSQMVSWWRPMKRLAYGEAALVPMAVPTSWRKCLSMNERLFLRMVSSNIPIVWGIGVPGSTVSALNFMQCNADSMPYSCGVLL